MIKNYIFLFTLLFSIHYFSQTSIKITPLLQTQIENNDPEKIHKVWIYFNDKGPDLNTKLKQVKSGLTRRSITRRSKSMKKNVIDHYDIPIYNQYTKEAAKYLENINNKSRWLNAISANVIGENISKIGNLIFVKKIVLVKNYKTSKNDKYFFEKSTVENIATINQHEHKLDYGPSLRQVDMLNIPTVHDLGFDGSGILICVCDAGFQNLNHEALDHLNILATWDFINNDTNVGSDYSGDWGARHGTAVLSDIGGYKEGQMISGAYNADYILAKTENVEFERHIEEDAWVAAAEWADSLGADIISTSLGYLYFDEGEGDYTWEDMDGNTTIITKAADIAASRGILVINAVGNLGTAPDGENTLGAHADGDSVLAVGSCDTLLQRAYYSGMGSYLRWKNKTGCGCNGNNKLWSRPTNT